MEEASERVKRVRALSQNCCSPQISTCSPTWKLSAPTPLGFYGDFIREGWLIKSLATEA